MTTKQWAARAVLAATMAAGLSACGGGGDSAVPAAEAPEVLAAGMVIKASTDKEFQPLAYADMKVIDVETDFDTETEYGRFAQNNEPGSKDHIELLVRFSKATGQISRATLVKYFFPDPFHVMGCGFDGFACDNSRITFNSSTNEIRITSLDFKSLTTTSRNGARIISDPSTHLAAAPGLATVSGIITLKK